MPIIEHAALWTLDLERARSFYERYFEAQAGPRYVNAQKQFTTYFLSFASGARLEIMHKPTVAAALVSDGSERQGYAHLEPIREELVHVQVLNYVQPDGGREADLVLPDAKRAPLPERPDP